MLLARVASSGRMGRNEREHESHIDARTDNGFGCAGSGAHLAGQEHSRTVTQTNPERTYVQSD